MGSRFNRRSYKKQTYIDGVRVTRKMLKALAVAADKAAAAEALKQKRAMLRRVKKEEEKEAKIVAAKEVQAVKSNEVKEE